MTVPLVDLPRHVASLHDEVIPAIEKVMGAGAFAGGPFVQDFEEEFSRYCGVPFVIGVGSGTEALWMTLLALRVGRGDEVITVPNTFIATAEAVSMTGAKPVFVDVNPVSYTMDPARIEDAITRRTRAIVPVHLYGQAADMGPILDVARRHGLPVVEDACQAHGAEYHGARAGSLGVAGCFSFYPGKNLGAFGEAGAVATGSREIADRIRAFRDHGQKRKYSHEAIGWNGRMDGLQAAILSAELPHLDAWNAARRTAANAYAAALHGVDNLLLPAEMPYGRDVYHVYALRVRARDAVMDDMRARGVQCGVHYPVPIHMQRAYRHLGLLEGTFPVSERCAEEILSLPMYPEITGEQIAYVAESLRAGLARVYVA